MKSRERMLDETVERQRVEITKLKVRAAELEVLVRSIRDAINIQLEDADGKKTNQVST